MSDVNIQKTSAIILRRYPLRETSLLLVLYTKDFGKIKGVIRGIRGPRGQSGSFPELFTLNKIVFYEAKRKEFYYINECDLIDPFQKIRQDLERTGYASYIAELTDVTSTFADKNEELFGLLLNSLRMLCEPISAKRVARIFEIRLLLLLGLMPEFNRCIQCSNKTGPKAKFSFRLGGLLCQNCAPADKEAGDILQGTVNFITHIEKSPYNKMSRIKVTKQVGEELEFILRKFLDMHVEKELKTVEFLKKIAA